MKGQKWLGGVCLYRMVREHLSEEVMFELLSESSGGRSRESIWREFLAEGMSSGITALLLRGCCKLTSFSVTICTVSPLIGLQIIFSGYFETLSSSLVGLFSVI